MKKVLALILALCTLFALCGCGAKTAAAPAEAAPTQAAPTAAPAQAAPAESAGPDVSERTIRFSTTSADGTTIADAMNLFADKVSELSGGKMKVEIYTNAQLGDAQQTLQNAQLGVQEMTMTQPTYLASSGAVGFTALSLPYIYKSLEHQMKVINGDIGTQLLGTVQTSGLKLIGIGFWSEGSRNFFTKEPVTCVGDMKGMKIRCQQTEVDTEMVKALGASPTPIAFGELYSALQTGVVDGAENPLDGIYSSKFYEVCKNVIMDEHSMPPTTIVFSEIIWNQMTEDEHQIIFDAWKAAADTNYDVVNAGMTKYKELLEAEGVTIVEPTDKEKWSEAMTDVYAKFGADCADVISAISAIK